MSRYLVVDASVVVKWYFPEQFSEHALSILDRALADETSLVAPDLMLYEVANVLWKSVRGQRLALEEAELALQHLVRSPIRLIEASLVASRALQIGADTGRTTYDASYLAVAEVFDTATLTADERLVNAVAQTRYRARAVWIGAWSA